jgi:hypothetical protein
VGKFDEHHWGIPASAISVYDTAAPICRTDTQQTVDQLADHRSPSQQ